MNFRKRSFSFVLWLVLAASAAAQCPGIRPKFSWASNGSSLVFTDQTGVFASERIWDFGDGGSGDSLMETHTYTFAGDDTVRLHLTVDGCPFSTSARVVHPGQSDACLSQISSGFTSEQVGNNQMLFTDQSQGDGSFLLYLWTFGDDSLALTPSAEHFYALPGAYDVSHSIGTVDSLFQTACVAGSAERIYVNGNTSTCDSSLFLNLTIAVNGNAVQCIAETALFNQDLTITSWEWEYGDGSYDPDGLANAEHFYGYGGDVQICVKVLALDTGIEETCFARNCVSVTLPLVVSVTDGSTASALRVYPVPFTGELWLDGAAVRRGASWRMIDALGREMHAGLVAGDGRDRLDLGILPTGMYTLILAGDRNAHALRVLKQ